MIDFHTRSHKNNFVAQTKRFSILLLMLSLCTEVTAQLDSNSNELKLWFNNPAKEWNDALPIGNGRLGAMVFGGVSSERIQLNESSVWTGSKTDFVNPKSKQSLHQVRSLLFEGKYQEAEKLVQQTMMGDKKVKSTYQTLGDLLLKFDGHHEVVSGYRRELNLEDAIARVNYATNDIEYTREMFSSAPDQVIVIRLTASKNKSISTSLQITRPGNTAQITGNDNTLWLTEHVGNGVGVKVAAGIQVRTSGGQLNFNEKDIRIRDADTVTIIIAAAANYSGKDEKALTNASLSAVAKRSYDELKNRHTADYQTYFKRVSLTLDDGTAPAVNLPTAERLAAVQQGNVDPSLVALYFQFGRYLLISSSRPGGLPANLQGIWADGLNPPWDADYHININIQMNYWLAEVANLSEMHEPFLRFIDNLRADGRRTAKAMYGLNGTVAHFTTDAWHFTEPYGEPKWAMWPMGMAWSVQHMWERYSFTVDRKFLRDFAYPAMKEASQFCTEWLAKDPTTGLLVSGPSISPENSFETKDGQRGTVVMGPTMDHMIIRELFQNTILASEILNVDNSFRSLLKEKLDQLAPTKVGKDGRILEWTQDFAEPEPGHRHISHLYSLHPGNEISKDSALLEAARKTITHRLSHGGGHTGWSRAWIINFFARLHDGEKAYENLVALLRKSTLPNLFDTHPPFQIDGNFGAAAGIIEMVLQSHTGEIVLLPALPEAWPSGNIHGLCARGGFQISINWKDGKLVEASILSKVGGICIIRYGEKVVKIKTEKGKEYTVDSALKIL